MTNQNVCWRKNLFCSVNKEYQYHHHYEGSRVYEVNFYIHAENLPVKAENYKTEMKLARKSQMILEEGKCRVGSLLFITVTPFTHTSSTVIHFYYKNPYYIVIAL